MLKKGEIWWVQLSVSDSDAVGHEQAKTRPCVIIKNNNFAEMTTIIPLTTNMKVIRFPYTYLIRKTKTNKLKFGLRGFDFSN
jgi:mRNA-degrading endonuclease toxin of MazEF toxin-antitoxin module